MQVSAIVRQASGACVRGCRSWPIGLSCLARAGFCRYASGGRARAREGGRREAMGAVCGKGRCTGTAVVP